MTDCNWAKELLVAAPEELSGEADTALARHIRDCPACTLAAQRILAANTHLDSALGSLPTVDAGALIARARSRDAEGSLSASPLRENARARAGRPWLAIPQWALAGGAAAVVAVGIALGTIFETVPPTVPPMPAPSVAKAKHPLLLSAPNRRVAVFQTGNPNITLLWLFKENDDE